METLDYVEQILTKAGKPILGRVIVKTYRRSYSGIMYQNLTGQKAVAIEGKRPVNLLHNRGLFKQGKQIWQVNCFFEKDPIFYVIHEIKDPLTLLFLEKILKSATYLEINFADSAPTKPPTSAAASNTPTTPASRTNTR